jgi:hydrogenase maturation protease
MGMKSLLPQAGRDQSSAKPRRRARLLVLGIGNILMSDDGIGVHAVRELRKEPHAGVFITEIGTAIFEAVPLLAWADRVLVVDALHAGGPPGTIYWAPFANILKSRGHLSLHELDLSAMLAFLPKDCTRPEIHVLGIEPASLDMGLVLSPLVSTKLPLIVSSVNDRLREWRKDASIRKRIADETVDNLLPSASP